MIVSLVTAGMCRDVGSRLRETEAAAKPAHHENQCKQDWHSALHLFRRYHVQVTRFGIFPFLVALAASALFAQTTQDGLADPVFAQVPFNEWLSQTGQSHIHWMARVSEPELSAHQRLITEVHVEVDGAELARR